MLGKISWMVSEEIGNKPAPRFQFYMKDWQKAVGSRKNKNTKNCQRTALGEFAWTLEIA
jgi:hypothetical protein